MSDEKKQWAEDVNGVWHWDGRYTVGRSEEQMPRWYATGPGMFAWSRGTPDAALYELSTAYKDSTRTLSGQVNEGRAEEVMEIRSAWIAQSMKRLAETAASIQWVPYIERGEFQGACEAVGMKPVDEDYEDYRHGEWFAAWDEGEVMVGIVNDVGDPDRAGDFPPTTTHNTLDGLRERLTEVGSAKSQTPAEPDQRAKRDAGKPDLTALLTLPAELFAPLAAARAHGVKKYGVDTWHNVSATRYVAAAFRHLWAARTEGNDPESGVSHYAHAALSLLLAMGVGMGLRSGETKEVAP